MLFKRVVAIGPHILRGSLIERYIRCGKPGCRCADTAGHGPKYYLSVSYPGQKPQQQYVLQKYQDQVKEFLSNYQQIREFFEEISSINRELLRRKGSL